MNPALYPFSSAFLGFVINSFWVRQALGCQQINVSCSDIKTLDGFKFKHGSSPEGSEIYVYDNGACTAHARLGNSSSLTLSPEVLRVDNGSVTTRSCRNITIQIIVPSGVIKGKSFVKETCVYFQAQTKTDPSDSQAALTLSSIPGIVVTATVIVGAIVMAWWCFQSWKTYLMRQRSEASVSGFIIHQLTCLCLRKREEREGTSSDTDPPGSGEAHEQDNTLESVHVHSIESGANTPQSPSLDCNFSNERIQTAKDGDIGAHNASRISHHRSMNRNLREDPGGVNSNKGQAISELDTADAAGNHAEDHETEGQPLLSNQRAASFDMTGEATPLVNKVSFDQDPVSRSWTALETDVESKKQHEELRK